MVGSIDDVELMDLVRIYCSYRVVKMLIAHLPLLDVRCEHAGTVHSDLCSMSSTTMHHTPCMRNWPNHTDRCALAIFIIFVGSSFEGLLSSCIIHSPHPDPPAAAMEPLNENFSPTAGCVWAQGSSVVSTLATLNLSGVTWSDATLKLFHRVRKTLGLQKHEAAYWVYDFKEEVEVIVA